MRQASTEASTTRYMLLIGKLTVAVETGMRTDKFTPTFQYPEQDGTKRTVALRDMEQPAEKSN
jgi:hypothetical protein